MKKLGIIVSLIITVIATALYHIGVKSFGATDVSTLVLVIRGVSDFFFAGMMMYTCTSVYWAVKSKNRKIKKYNFIDMASNISLLCMIFAIEGLVEQVLTSQSEIKVTITLIIAIVAEINMLRFQKMENTILMQIITTDTIENVNEIL